MLIGDKTGPAIIALTYGDVRPDHLLKQAQRIRLTVQEIHGAFEAPDLGESSIKRSITSCDVSSGLAGVPGAAETVQAAGLETV